MVSARPTERSTRAASASAPRRVGEVEQYIGDDDGVGGPADEREGERVSTDSRGAALGAGDVKHSGGGIQGHYLGCQCGRADRA
jgi:hypothetical protein